MKPDDPLVRIFNRPGCALLLERARQRLARGQPLTGTITIDAASEEERADIALLVGRRVVASGGIRIQLQAIDQHLRGAGHTSGLQGAVETVLGPVTNERKAREEESAHWTRLWTNFELAVQENPALVAWLQDLRSTGLLIRASRRSIEAAEEMMGKALRIGRKLPARGTRLASLAAEATGDSHALDSGTGLASLVLRLQKYVGSPAFESVDDEELSRRAKWAALGVASDELSGPALVVGLGAASSGYLGRVLRTSVEAGEPALLPLRILLKERIETMPAGTRVFVCENPTIVSMAADDLGSRCPPLVCTQGMPNAATQALLRQLVRAGATLCYHGDFDWPGITIGRWVMSNLRAQAWRFGAADYMAAPKGIRLSGDKIATSWDERLAEAMKTEGTVAHEESVATTLIDDLRKHINI